MITAILLGILVFFTTAGIHVSDALVTRETVDYRYRAALWRLVQWICAVVAFVVALKVSLWYLIPEGVGVAIGGLAGLRILRRRRARGPARRLRRTA